MTQTDFFYRDIKTLDFLHDNASIGKKIVPCVPKNDYVPRDMFFDSEKNAWTAANGFDFSGKIAIDYAEKAEDVKFPSSILEAAKSQRMLHWLSSGYAETESAPYEIEDYSAGEMADYLDYRRKCERARFARRNSYDAGRIPKQLFAVEIETDTENLVLSIKARYFNALVTPVERGEYDSGETTAFLSFDMKNGTVSSSVELVKYYDWEEKSTARDFKKTQENIARFTLPRSVASFAFEKLIFLARLFTKLQIKADCPEKTGDILCKMHKLVFLPCEYKLCDVIFADKDYPFKVNLNRLNANIYNDYCKSMHIKSRRVLRKAYEERPESLLTFLRIKKCRFSDANIFNSILTSKELYEFFDKADINELRFFCRIAFKKRGELPALNLLKKAAKNGYFVLDSISMFYDYYRSIPKSLVDDILSDGFTHFNHDALSNISYKCQNPYIKFRYTAEQKRLEDDIDGFSFRLPVDSNQLAEIGSSLHNCVASYAKNVKKKDCTIVYAKKDGKYELCIEVVKKSVRQELTNRNARPTDEQVSALDKWHARHSLDARG